MDEINEKNCFVKLTQKDINQLISSGAALEPMMALLVRDLSMPYKPSQLEVDINNFFKNPASRTEHECRSAIVDMFYKESATDARNLCDRQAAIEFINVEHYQTEILRLVRDRQRTIKIAETARDMLRSRKIGGHTCSQKDVVSSKGDHAMAAFLRDKLRSELKLNDELILEFLLQTLNQGGMYEVGSYVIMEAFKAAGLGIVMGSDNEVRVALGEGELDGKIIVTIESPSVAIIDTSNLETPSEGQQTFSGSVFCCVEIKKKPPSTNSESSLQDIELSLISLNFTIDDKPSRDNVLRRVIHFMGHFNPPTGSKDTVTTPKVPVLIDSSSIDLLNIDGRDEGVIAKQIRGEVLNLHEERFLKMYVADVTNDMELSKGVYKIYTPPEAANSPATTVIGSYTPENLFALATYSSDLRNQIINNPVLVNTLLGIVNWRNFGDVFRDPSKGNPLTPTHQFIVDKYNIFINGLKDASHNVKNFSKVRSALSNKTTRRMFINYLMHDKDFFSRISSKLRPKIFNELTTDELFKLAKHNTSIAKAILFPSFGQRLAHIFIPSSFSQLARDRLSETQQIELLWFHPQLREELFKKRSFFTTKKDYSALFDENSLIALFLPQSRNRLTPVDLDQARRTAARMCIDNQSLVVLLNNVKPQFKNIVYRSLETEEARTKFTKVIDSFITPPDCPISTPGVKAKATTLASAKTVVSKEPQQVALKLPVLKSSHVPNTNYWYTDSDVYLALTAIVNSELGGFLNPRSGGVLLQNTFSENGTDYRVALYPPVSATIQGIDDGSDKQRGLRIADSIFPKKFDSSIEAGDGSESTFAHEILPLLQSHGDINLKFVFPIADAFASGTSEATWHEQVLQSGHWKSVEIFLCKIGHVVTLRARQDDANATESLLDSGAWNEVVRCFTDNLKKFGLEVDNENLVNQKTTNLRRQSDGVSCGPIVVDQIVRRIKGEALAEIIPAGALKLREQQITALKKYQNITEHCASNIALMSNESSNLQGLNSSINDVYQNGNVVDIDSLVRDIKSACQDDETERFCCKVLSQVLKNSIVFDACLQNASFQTLVNDNEKFFNVMRSLLAKLSQADFLSALDALRRAPFLFKLLSDDEFFGRIKSACKQASVEKLFELLAFNNHELTHFLMTDDAMLAKLLSRPEDFKKEVRNNGEAARHLYELLMHRPDVKHQQLFASLQSDFALSCLFNYLDPTQLFLLCVRFVALSRDHRFIETFKTHFQTLSAQQCAALIVLNSDVCLHFSDKQLADVFPLLTRCLSAREIENIKTIILARNSNAKVSGLAKVDDVQKQLAPDDRDEFGLDKNDSRTAYIESFIARCSNPALASVTNRIINSSLRESTHLTSSFIDINEIGSLKNSLLAVLRDPLSGAEKVDRKYLEFLANAYLRAKLKSLDTPIPESINMFVYQYADVDLLLSFLIASTSPIISKDSYLFFNRLIDLQNSNSLSPTTLSLLEGFFCHARLSRQQTNEKSNYTDHFVSACVNLPLNSPNSPLEKILVSIVKAKLCSPEDAFVCLKNVDADQPDHPLRRMFEDPEMIDWLFKCSIKKSTAQEVVAAELRFESSQVIRAAIKKIPTAVLPSPSTAVTENLYRKGYKTIEEMCRIFLESGTAAARMCQSEYLLAALMKHAKSTKQLLIILDGTPEKFHAQYAGDLFDDWEKQLEGAMNARIGDRVVTDQERRDLKKIYSVRLRTYYVDIIERGAAAGASKQARALAHKVRLRVEASSALQLAMLNGTTLCDFEIQLFGNFQNILRNRFNKGIAEANADQLCEFVKTLLLIEPLTAQLKKFLSHNPDALIKLLEMNFSVEVSQPLFEMLIEHLQKADGVPISPEVLQSFYLKVSRGELLATADHGLRTRLRIALSSSRQNRNNLVQGFKFGNKDVTATVCHEALHEILESALGEGFTPKLNDFLEIILTVTFYSGELINCLIKYPALLIRLIDMLGDDEVPPQRLKNSFVNHFTEEADVRVVSGDRVDSKGLKPYGNAINLFNANHLSDADLEKFFLKKNLRKFVPKLLENDVMRARVEKLMKTNVAVALNVLMKGSRKKTSNEMAQLLTTLLADRAALTHMFFCEHTDARHRANMQIAMYRWISANCAELNPKPEYRLLLMTFLTSWAPEEGVAKADQKDSKYCDEQRAAYRAYCEALAHVMMIQRSQQTNSSNRAATTTPTSSTSSHNNLSSLDDLYASIDDFRTSNTKWVFETNTYKLFWDLFGGQGEYDKQRKSDNDLSKENWNLFSKNGEAGLYGKNNADSSKGLFLDQWRRYSDDLLIPNPNLKNNVATSSSNDSPDLDPKHPHQLRRASQFPASSRIFTDNTLVPTLLRRSQRLSRDVEGSQTDVTTLIDPVDFSNTQK